MTDLASKRKLDSAVRSFQSHSSDPLERSLADERARWNAAFDRAPQGMELVDLKGRVLAANDALCSLLGRDAAEICGTDFRSLTHPLDRAAGRREIRRAVLGEIDSFELEERYLRVDEEILWVRLSARMVRDTNGTPLYFLVHMHDISARKAAETQLVAYADQLQDLARRDPLTGLWNYRTFHGRLDELLTDRTDGSELSIVLFDVDHFRELNGHDGRDGDALLEAVAAVVSGACRASDISARIGPDEFALILPDTTPQTARGIATRVASEVERTVGVSMSFGVAGWMTDLSPIALVLRADAELRAAKRDNADYHSTKPGRTVGLEDDQRDDINRLVKAAGRVLEAEVVYLTQWQRGIEHVLAVAGDGARFGIAAGAPAPGAVTRSPDPGSQPNGAPIQPKAGDRTALADSPGSTQGGTRVRMPLRLRDGHTFGALCAELCAPTPDPRDVRLDLLRSVADVIAEKLDLESADMTARRQREELIGMNALVAALSARDRYTGEHSKTVVRLAVAVAHRMGLEEKVVRQVEQVALLHDIGKVGIPDSILQKSGPLSSSEWELMREHPAIGARILAGTRTLAHLAPAVHAEHEWVDGTGYPLGLCGSAIPVASRITLACDAYDAMTTDRPYRARLDSARAEQELRAGAGTQFDASVVAALLDVVATETSAREASPDPASTPSPAG